ncbi:MAG TPA: biotin/lipoyl-containing protein [Polyangiaceae bacterium]
MARSMRYVVSVRGREIAVDVTPLAAGRLCVAIEGSKAPPLEVTLFGNAEAAAVGGKHVLELRASGGDVTIGSERRPVRVESRDKRERSPSANRAGSSGIVRAPMPGRVVKVLVELGASVEQGTGVVVVEAMKMENELVSPISGGVERVFVKAGDAVERGAPLVEIR